MKNKIVLICFILGLVFLQNTYSQEGDLKSVEYTVIAEGVDSPIPNLQIVCFNKYFNKDYLPFDFRKKYKLNEKGLYKKKMLIEIFHSDEGKKGLDEIELVGITENEKKLVVEYKLRNSDLENDDKGLAPFLIVQVPKSKKEIEFIVGGTGSGKATDLYVE